MLLSTKEGGLEGKDFSGWFLVPDMIPGITIRYIQCCKGGSRRGKEGELEGGVVVVKSTDVDDNSSSPKPILHEL